MRPKRWLAIVALAASMGCGGATGTTSSIVLSGCESASHAYGRTAGYDCGERVAYRRVDGVWQRDAAATRRHGPR